MPTKRELRDLADRVEAANLNDESQMMQEVGQRLAAAGPYFIALEYGPAVDEGDYCRAAKILVRYGYEWCEGQAGAQVLAFSEIDKPPHKASASTPALSLTAAYLRALAGKAFNQPPRPSPNGHGPRSGMG